MCACEPSITDRSTRLRDASGRCRMRRVGDTGFAHRRRCRPGDRPCTRCISAQARRSRARRAPTVCSLPAGGDVEIAQQGRANARTGSDEGIFDLSVLQHQSFNDARMAAGVEVTADVKRVVGVFQASPERRRCSRLDTSN